MSDPSHLDMSSVTFFIPKNCKASGATSAIIKSHNNNIMALAIIHGTYQHEK